MKPDYNKTVKLHIHKKPLISEEDSEWSLEDRVIFLYKKMKILENRIEKMGKLHDNKDSI